MSYTNEQIQKKKELQARFFPTKPVTVIRPSTVAWEIEDDAPVSKDVRIPPEFEPMEAEEFAKKLRRGEFPKSPSNLKRLIEKLAIDLKVPYEDIMSVRRTSKIAAARNFVYWYLRRRMKVRLNMIGYIMQRDHSTVLSGIKRHEGNGRDRRLKKDQVEGEGA